MEKNPLRLLVAIFITFVVAGLVYKAKSMDPIKNDKFFQFPLSIKDWQGNEVPMSEWVYQGLETPYVFLRNYSSPKENLPVNLSLVWFDDTNYAFHAPEACMNSIMRDREMVSIRIGNSGNHEVVKMIVEINNQKQLLIYFFDVDGFITTKQSIIRLESLKKRLLLKRTSAVFVRLMAPVESNQKDTMRVILTFLDVIYPILPEYTYTERIVGR
jgi:EpsI family protein